MLIVEILRSGVPIIYRSDRVQHLVSRKRLYKVYEFACKAQLLQRLKFYEYDFGANILRSLEIEPVPPVVYAVKVPLLRRYVRKKRRLPTSQEIEREDKCVPSIEFNCLATSEQTPK